LPTVNGILTGVVGSEFVNFVFWRTPCTGGRSALLGLFIRDQALQNTLPQPIFGGIFLTQGTVSHFPARIASDPNTFFSDIAGVPFLTGFAFVFENGPNYQIDYSQAIALEINGLPSVPGVIPAYDPSQYNTASLPLQLSGYLTGNFFDPAHGGEGAQVEVFATPNSTARGITFAWYTFDSGGVPFWLFAQGGFTEGDRSVTIPVYYGSQGGFAGNFGNASFAAWGNIVVQFPDCNTMIFSYTANGGLPNYVPQGSGTRTWTRLTNINGVTCQ
jgi:hypothetical protein